MNEQTETTEQPGQQNDPLPVSPSPAELSSSTPITPQVGCPTCGGQGRASGPNPNTAAAISYVYAIGRIELRFPSLGVEKEFAQARRSRSVKTEDLTDPQTVQTVLCKPENLYIARQLCWVLSIQGLDTYLLVPRHPTDFSLLLESIRDEPSRNDTDVVIGMRGPIASPTVCNGLMLPIVAFDQIYSFHHEKLMTEIPPDKTDQKKFRRAAEQVFNMIMQLTDNAGATDEHRALNYLAMRYPGIYTRVAEAFSHNFSLSGVEARPSFSGQRRSVDVIFTYTHRENLSIDKSYVRVDVTEEFPFLLRAMSPYYDRDIGGAR